MIDVKVFKKKDSVGFNINGHADYAEHGEDIVCAAVSVLSYTIYRSLIVNLSLEKKMNAKQNDGFMSVVVSIRNEQIDLLFDTFIEGMRSLEEGYGDFIRLTLEED